MNAQVAQGVEIATRLFDDDSLGVRDHDRGTTLRIGERLLQVRHQCTELGEKVVGCIAAVPPGERLYHEAVLRLHRVEEPDERPKGSRKIEETERVSGGRGVDDDAVERPRLTAGRPPRPG